MSRDDDLRAMSKRELEREVIRLRHLLSEQMSAAPGVGPDVTVEGVVRSRDGVPEVHMRAGEAMWAFTPAEARQHAFLTLNAAVEAERDAATVDFLQKGGFDEKVVGGFLVGMREHRVEWFDDLFRSGK